MTTVRIPASTTNLGPGFDTLGLALQLYNHLSLARAEKDEVEVRGEGARSVPRDRRNLAFRAVSRCFEELGLSPGPLRLELDNRIPVGRGLGSSAAAIGGGLVGANSLAGESLPRERLLELAAALEGHPDNVAPALYGGLQLVVAGDAGLLRLQLPVPEGLRAVVVIPGYELSTDRARAVLPVFVPRRDAVFNVGRAALLVGALCGGRLELRRTAKEDRLHQPYRADLMPGYAAALAAGVDAGALGTCLSGAGSTLLALVQDKGEAVAEAMCDALKENGVEARGECLAMDEAGATVLAESPPSGGGP